MDIVTAQREMCRRFLGGFYGQFVSGVLWLVSAGFATWSTPRHAILALVIGGFFIFPVTELLIRISGSANRLSRDNLLPQLGMQVAFVLPLSMPLLVPVTRYHLHWFYPAMMILVGAHYLPFVFLYGMRMFAVLCAMLLVPGMMIAFSWSEHFAIGAWYTGMVLLMFAAIGKAFVRLETRSAIHTS